VEYSFDIDVAKEHGINEAILIKNFQFWNRYNKANGKNCHDGRHWTYNTLHAFTEQFPFWTIKQLRRILNKLVANKVLVKGSFSKNRYDRTIWYAFADEDKWLRVRTGKDNSMLPVEDVHLSFSTTIVPKRANEYTDRKPDTTTTTITTNTTKKEEIQQVIDYWNGFSRLPKVVALSTSRREQLVIRLKQPHFAEHYKAVFKKLSESSFALGSNDRNWKVSLDWVIANDHNYIKVLEGKYDNKSDFFSRLKEKA